jgi:uncharacterized protein (TIGR03118 family)
MQSFVRRALTLAGCLAMALMLANIAVAQSYSRKNLVANVSGKAPHTDTLLQNPWGLAYTPTGAFWVSDEASGFSTLYDGAGNPQTLQVKVPPSAGTHHGTPTGIVSNGSSEFKINTWTSVFLFATLDGTISGWSTFSPNNALIAVRQAGAAYTGLAITSHATGNFLYAADTANNRVDVYDGNFNLVKSLTDPHVPAGFSVFGVQDIAGQVYVTYASTSGVAGGAIDVFAENGTFVKRLVTSKTLNQAWGLAVAPANWGPLSGTLLVSNNTSSGTINGFDLTTGKLVGTVKNSLGNPITINGLWGIEFGGGAALNGKRNQLFFTAGPGDTAGFFGLIAFH